MRRSLLASAAASCLVLMAIGCGKVSMATPSDSAPASAPAVIAEGGALRESSSPLGKDHSEVAATKETMVRLERTVCYGMCPAYSVEIRGDGAVAYEGKAFVGKKGKHTAHLDAQALRALAARFDQAAFFRLDWADPCDMVATDSPTATLTFATGLRTRTIIDYHGNGCMPKVLRDLEDEVDRVAGTAVWVGCNTDASAGLGDCPR